ncbi:MAG: hypothetical protein ISS78_06805 [Phycisphaerae bacterium]|nr:hypothetical protein [Phycisphaerae bacterium]
MIGGPVICESELSAFAWRLTAFLEPRPGKWGSADGDFYFNPYIGAGVGYHVLREQLSVSLAYQALQVDETVDGLGFHAVLGADFVIKRRLSLGFSLISSVVKKDVGWREAELGGDVVYFHADWRY